MLTTLAMGTAAGCLTRPRHSRPGSDGRRRRQHLDQRLVEGTAYMWFNGGKGDIKAVCAGRKWKHFAVVMTKGWDVKRVRMQECVDNSWHLENCSKPKQVYPI